MIFEHVFRLQLEGVSLPSQQTFSVPEKRLTAKLDACSPMQLTVRVTDVTELEADQRASQFAQMLYFRFLLRFGSRITKSERPTLSGKTVIMDDSISATAVAVKLPTLTVAILGAVTSPLSQGALDELAGDIQLRFAVPELPTSAPLYAAIGMFAAGMEAQNSVVRFLILYSALTLASLFRWNRGGQTYVDRLLLERNPAIPTSASPKNVNMQETLYTKLRNDLVRAEERGWDPAVAIGAIEKNVSKFQRDATLVFSNL
jgi:hypothetical protein